MHIRRPPFSLIILILSKQCSGSAHPRLRNYLCSIFEYLSVRFYYSDSWIVNSVLTPISYSKLILRMTCSSCDTSTPMIPKRKFIYFLEKAPSSKPIKYGVSPSCSSLLILRRSCYCVSTLAGKNRPSDQIDLIWESLSKEKSWKK